MKKLCNVHSLWIVISMMAFTNIVVAQEKSVETKWIRARKIDIKHIAIDLKFDWTTKQAFGKAAITFSPLQPSDKISLDAGMLTINSISLVDGTSLKFKYDSSDKDDALEINLGKVCHENENVTITIDYRTNWINKTDPNNLGGSFGKGIRFISPTPTEPNRRKQLWTVGEPESNRYWFPCYDYPNDLRTTELTATVDKNLTVISNGDLIEKKNNDDGTQTFHWKADVPYANHLTSFVVGEYRAIEQNFGETSLSSYSYPGEEAATTASVERLPDMMKFFSSSIGVNYPHKRYSQVFVPDFFGWMGNSGASTITENMVDDDRTHADFLYLWDVTEGEALAHQWFGSSLSPRSWSDIWLDKSFSQYFSGLYNEHKNGKDEFLLWQHGFCQGTYLSDWSAGVRMPVVNKNYEDVSSFTFSNYPYLRGAAVLHTLRKQLGEEKWWKAIHHYVSTNSGKSVTTEDFRKAIEDSTGEPMDWFFDQWIYKIGHPIFDIKKNYDAVKKQLTLTVRQVQKKDTITTFSQAEFFQGKLDVEIDDHMEQVWLKASEENIFTFSLPEEPKLINFDFESTWLKEMAFARTVDENIYLLLHSKDALAKQSVMGELVTAARDGKSTQKEKEKIYTALRSVVSGNQYWRVRLIALSSLQSLIAPSSLPAPVPLDSETTKMLLSIIKNDKAWLRASAIRFLGMTCNPKYTDLYVNALNDLSDRVISTAAVSLGKTKSTKAFDALAKLVSKPSWKNQSLMSSLAGLKELGDKRGYDIAIKALEDVNLSRWTLPTPPVWDFRILAAQTIASLGRQSEAYPLIFSRFKKSLEENDDHVIFNYALLIATLGDARGHEAFDLLKTKYKDDENAMMAVNQFESQLPAIQ